MDRSNSRWAEFGEYLVRVTLAMLLLALCTVGPALLGVYVNPWLGLLAATGGVYLWGAVFPPFPGYWNGHMCTTGCGPLMLTWVSLLMLCLLSLFTGGRLPQ